ncbi:MAG: hypothetical protein M0R21_09575 [Lentimicrobiaceae bacterium]|nr:hypothetical protein [Lentimicrobiaceae bacterium]
MNNSYKQAFIEVLQLGSERAVADMVVDKVERDSEKFAAVLALCFSEKYPISMRAARVVQLCCSKYPKLLVPHYENVILLLAQTKVSGVKRNFLKIFDEYSELKNIPNPGVLLNLCFDWLNNPSEDIAIRVFAMGVLYKFAKSEPDLTNELSLVIQNQLEYETSPGFINKAGKILKKLGTGQ